MKPYCKKLQDRLATEGPGGLREDARARRHLVGCTRCFAVLEAAGELERGLRFLPMIDAPDGVVQSLLARPELAGASESVPQTGRTTLIDRLWPWLERNGRPGPLVWATGTVAAVAVLAVLGLPMLWHVDLPDQEPQLLRVRKYVPPPPRIDRGQELVRPEPPSYRPLPDPTPEEHEPRMEATSKMLSTAEAEMLGALGYVGPETKSRDDDRQAENAPSRTTFADEFVQDLPVPGRFYQNVLTLAPGVQDSKPGNRSRANEERIERRPMSQVDVGSIEEVDRVGSGADSSHVRGGFANVSSEQGEAAAAARRFLAERARHEGLTFQDASGYWSNAYVPGDPGLRLLRWRLARMDRERILPALDSDVLLHEGSRRPGQPYDPPKDSALAVFVHTDRASIDQPGRTLLEVGLQGARRRGGTRPAMNLGVILDLRGEIPLDVATSIRALLEALNQAKQAGDRFRVVVAGRPGATVIAPDEFRHGYLAVTLENLLEGGRPSDGPMLDLRQATASAIRQVSDEDDPSTPLGSSAVMLVTHQPLGEAADAIADMAHQGAVAGVPSSVVAIGDGVRLDEIDRITLAGQGHRRLLASASEARALIDRQLAATSRVIARAIRLRIRLAPGVHLVEVVGASRLDDVATRRVREAERSIDLRLAQNLGIQADRGEDEEGIQIVIPNFYAGDRHSILLDLVVDRPGVVADVSVRYKDLIFLRNGVARSQLSLPAGRIASGPLEYAVLRSYLSQRLHGTLEQAGAHVADGDTELALDELNASSRLLEGIRTAVPGFERDRDMERDLAMLAGYRRILAGDELKTPDQIAYVADSLRYAAQLKRLRPLANE